MIGDGEHQPHQLQQRSQQAFRLAQSQAEHHAECQGGLDRKIGTARLAAPGLTTWGSPTNKRFRRQPQGQAAALAEARLIFRPVRHPEFHLAYTMTAGRIVFDRHRCGNRLLRLQPASTIIAK